MSNELFDILLPILRTSSTWVPLYIAIIVYLIWQNRLKSWIPILSLLCLIAVSDTLSSRVVKSAVGRARPCQIVDQYPETIVRVHCGSGYSFTSSHATNHFALAILIPFVCGFRQRWVRWSFIFWALSIGFSQIYVGVHYPFDVICGSILGAGIGIVFVKLYKSYALPKLSSQSVPPIV
jgi:membrane-associated phospholipid phosphatase